MAEIIAAADSSALTYIGRTENYNGFPRFVFAGTSVTVRFKGTGAKCVIRNHRFYNVSELGFVIDGRREKAEFEHKEEDIVITLCEGLEDTEHELTLYKKHAGSHYFEFKGFILSEGAELLAAKPLPKRKIECYGDSVSAGEVVLAVDYTASTDPEGHDGIYDDAWLSYPMITARNLGAQLNNIAQGGIAIFDNTGYYHAPNFIGMETAYDKVCYFPEAEGGMTNWDFSKYTPDLVIFAVGQNDPHNEGNPDNDINDPVFREKWKNGYKKIISDLRSKYPNAVFVLLLTVLMHSPDWDNVLDEIVAELHDEKISHFKFTRTGKATPGHPRITEQYEMAEELTAYISSMGGGIWSE
ncbi:MAG: electron transporter RnfD [Oscillospiraceae bacterium]